MDKVQVGVGPFTRRPDNSAFKQQRLPAWSPSLTPHTVLPIFYSLSVVCVLLGVWLHITVQNTHQLKVSYSVCVCVHQKYLLSKIGYHKFNRNVKPQPGSNKVFPSGFLSRDWRKFFCCFFSPPAKRFLNSLFLPFSFCRFELYRTICGTSDIRFMKVPVRINHRFLQLCLPQKLNWLLSFHCSLFVSESKPASS